MTSFEGAGEDWPGEPQHGDHGTCAKCGQEIEFFQEAKWNGVEDEVLSSWWSHLKHPEDNHDAEHGGPA